MTAPVKIDDVSHRFGDFEALSHINLDIGAGEYVALLGPSGCGKTTLLSVMGGFLKPTGGRILIGGDDVTGMPASQRPTTTVFQDYALFPHMTLLDNVSFGLRMAGQGREQRYAKAREMLELVGLGDAGKKRPHALSGGQRQRVALARALAVDPQVLLLDEPLGALDLALRRTMQDKLKAIQRQIGTTFVHVTHDQEEAMAIADRIVVMNKGKIEDHGAPARIYRKPASLFAAGFMGETNRIPARATGKGLETPFGTVAHVGGSGEMILCLRPESIGTAQRDLPLGKVRVQDAAFFGTHTRAHVTPEAAQDMTLVAHLPPDSVPEPGAVLMLHADLGTMTVFPKEQ